MEALRRIEREVLTASLLARKTGMQQPHISNFLRSKRRLSLNALDRVLAALEISVADLAAVRADPAPASGQDLEASVPLVSQEVAMHEDRFRPAAVTEQLHLPRGLLAGLAAEHGVRVPVRERFVAVGITPAQAAPMTPVLRPNGIVVLDRHSNMPSAASASARSVYAVRVGRQLQFAYLSFDRGFLVLRPHLLDFPVQLLPVPPGAAPSGFVTGRVCAVTQLL